MAAWHITGNFTIQDSGYVDLSGLVWNPPQEQLGIAEQAQASMVLDQIRSAAQAHLMLGSYSLSVGGLASTDPTRKSFYVSIVPLVSQTA